MKKIMFFAAAAVAMTLASCGGDKSSDNVDGTSTENEDEKIEAKTLSVPFLASMPIEGDQADYFAIEGGDVTITGTAPEDPDDHQGTIRATVKIKVLKPFENLKGFAVFPPMTLYFLNADKELIDHTRLEMSKSDQDVILAELKKANPGEVEISYKGEFYGSTYNKIFDNVKYVQIQSASLSDGTKSSSSDGSVSSASDDDDASDSDLLERYSKLVDEYVSAVNSGSAAKVASLAADMASVYGKLSKASLGASDAAKLAKIAGKANGLAAKAAKLAGSSASDLMNAASAAASAYSSYMGSSDDDEDDDED